MISMIKGANIMIKKLNEHDKKEMRKNVESYNRMYGSFLKSMKSVQMFYLLFALALLIGFILYNVFK